MIPPSGLQVQLAAHDQELVVVEVGGGIRSYTAGSRDVVDGYAVSEMCNGGRGQILAPWPNRLAGGRFEWERRTLQTAITEVGAGNAIHGLVRWATWSVESAAADHARLVHRLHPQPGWPWILDLAVTYRLEPGGLTVTTDIVNASGSPCPLGVGWHPYLAAFGGVVDDCVLSLPAATAYRSDEKGIPVDRFPVAGTDLDFRTERPVGPAALDVCFTDLERDGQGRAVVRLVAPDGGASTCLWTDRTYSHLMVYSGDTLDDPGRRRRGLAVEPMTGPPDLLRSGDGRRVLEPGEMLTANWGFEPSSR